MKANLIILFFSALISLSFIPENKEPDLSSFIQYVSSHYQLPEAVRNDCHWNYAIIKVFPNQHNVITRYEVVNYASKDMQGMFNYLVGYQFAQGLHLNQRPVVFCFSVDNKKQSCAVEQNAHSPTEVMGRALSAFGEQHQKDPNAILIYEMIVAQIYDTMR